MKPDVCRGGEKWMINAAAGLMERGHDVHCIGKPDALWLKGAADRSLAVHPFPIHGDFDPLLILKLRHFFIEHKTRLLCCNFEKDVRLGGVAARLAGVPCIFVRKGLTLIFDKPLYRFTYRNIVDHIISPAHFIKKNFARFRWLNQDRIFVVHNGVEIPDTVGWDRRLLHGELKITDNHPIIFAAGSLFYQKGFEYLIDAVKMVHRQGLLVHCAIAGEGDQNPYRKLAADAGIDGYVHFLGHRTDVARLMFCADLFVLSSIDEGLPNVVLEAMSVGTTVVATCAGGTDEIIIDGENGLIVPIGNSAALADSIARCLRDNDLLKRLSANGLQSVKERFSIPRMVENVESLFQTKLDNSPRNKKQIKE